MLSNQLTAEESTFCMGALMTPAAFCTKPIFPPRAAALRPMMRAAAASRMPTRSPFFFR